MASERPEASPERCPFDANVVRAQDCPYEDECPWHVREDDDNCFCAVGESPELQMRKMIASKLPEEED